MRGLLLLFLAIAASGCLMHPYTGGSENNTNASAVPPAPVQSCLGPVCGADGNTYDTDCGASDAHIAVLYVGACQPPEPACNDSDGGLNTSVAGVATKGNETHDDYCLDAAQLVEYGCLDNSITMSTVQCGAGMECRDGACVENQTAQPVCAGHDEPDVYTKQSVTWNGTIYSDLCVEYGSVKDYYCQGQKLMSINNDCPPGYACTGGACIPKLLSCSETDAGNDTSLRGKTTVVYGINIISADFDSCVDVQTIKEYYCLSNGSSSYSEFSCGNGKKCFDGRCVTSMCTETDAGRDIYDAGTTTASGHRYSDDCLDDHTVLEYYCYGDDAVNEKIGCGTGYACDGARCVPA